MKFRWPDFSAAPAKVLSAFRRQDKGGILPFMALHLPTPTDQKRSAKSLRELRGCAAANDDCSGAWRWRIRLLNSPSRLKS
jgi:hypothetical protein